MEAKENPGPSTGSTLLLAAGAGITVASSGAAPAAGALLGLAALGYQAIESSVRFAPQDPANVWEPDYPASTVLSDGCVHVKSRLPGKKIACEVQVGDALELADEASLDSSAGVVSYSERKSANGYRITAEGGVSLVCSDSAPIPTPEGLVTAPDLGGKKVAVRVDEGNLIRIEWRRVTSVEAIGLIEVQHITVGDKSFWAGEKTGSYILHHNLKQITTVGTNLWDYPWPL